MDQVAAFRVQGAGLRRARLADVRRAADPRGRRPRGRRAGAGRAPGPRGRPGPVGAGAAAARVRAPPRPGAPRRCAGGLLPLGRRHLGARRRLGGVPRRCSRSSPTRSRSGWTGPRRPTRSAAPRALYGGLLHLPRDLPVRLSEIGCSAGLNLRADRFAYVDDDRPTVRRPTTPTSCSTPPGRAGPSTRGRRCTSWSGSAATSTPSTRRPPRAGSLLTAYVWPDQRARLERLRGALRAAAATPVEVRRQDAAVLRRRPRPARRHHDRPVALGDVAVPPRRRPAGCARAPRPARLRRHGDRGGSPTCGRSPPAYRERSTSSWSGCAPGRAARTGSSASRLRTVSPPRGSD